MLSSISSLRLCQSDSANQEVSYVGSVSSQLDTEEAKLCLSKVWQYKSLALLQEGYFPDWRLLWHPLLTLYLLTYLLYFFLLRCLFATLVRGDMPRYPGLSSHFLWHEILLRLIKMCQIQESGAHIGLFMSCNSLLHNVRQSMLSRVDTGPHRSQSQLSSQTSNLL